MLCCPLACSLSAACGDDEPYPLPPSLKARPMEVRPVEWNLRQAALGQVAAVTERGDDVVVLTDEGVRYFSAGLLRSTDRAVTAWRQAALVPAADGAGEWFLGVDELGRLWRLRPGAAAEEVRERYGLGGERLRDLVALGEGAAAFALEPQGLALWSRGTVVRYEGAFPTLAGGGGRLVTVVGGAVRLFDGGAGRSWALPGVVAAAVEPSGKLLAATAAALYREAADGALQRIHAEPEGTAGLTIRALATAGTGTWIVLGETLGLLRGGDLLRSPVGLLPTGARVIGSPTGDLWALAGGRLLRFGEEGGGGPDQQEWKKSILPIFTRACSQCHLPGATAFADLSTYAAWAERRALIEQRVIQGKPSPMPPPGAALLTAEEIDALRRWLAATPPQM